MHRPEYKKNIKQAFVLDETSIEKILNIFSTNVKCVEISTTCDDGITRYFENTEKLKQFENVENKKINSLSISGASENFTFDVEFRTESFLSPISIKISGSEDMIKLKTSEILDLLQGIKPSYSSLSGLDFLMVCVFLFPSVLIYLVAFDKMQFLEGFAFKNNFPFKEVYFLLFFWVMATSIGIGVLLNTLKAIFYPRGFFKIGQEIFKFEKYEKVRNCLSIAAFIGILITFFGNKLLEKIFH